MQQNDGWSCKPFAQLTTDEVYDLLRLRAEIFVVEQDCAYLDPDGMDQAAWHWLYRENGRLLASERCLAPGTAYPHESSIGRVVVDRSGRGRQLGRELLLRGIEFNRARWPECAILIGAQSYLQQFYESLGFVVCSESYMEDGIPHLKMRFDKRLEQKT